MRADVARDMTRSQSAFVDLVWPCIGQHIGGGRVISMENSQDNELRTLFDVTSGIDAWQIATDGGMYGIASRVQPYGTDWSTFTIRYSRDSGARTEWDKLSAAVNARDSRLYPTWFIQAYTSKDSKTLLSCAAVRTAELVCHIEWLCQENLDTRTTSNARFWFVGWDKPARNGASFVGETDGTSLVVIRPAGDATDGTHPQH